jgi:putative lipoic acid-binding regulatory protein
LIERNKKEMKQSIAASLLLLGGVQSFTPLPTTTTTTTTTTKTTTTSVNARMLLSPSLKMTPDGPAGSFFHPVPNDDDDDIDNNTDANDDGISSSAPLEFDDAVSKLIQQRSQPPLASQPSTINGVPTEKATGFGKPKDNDNAKNPSKNKKNTIHKKSPAKPYVAIGPKAEVERINDPTQPQVDDQGYTLYTDEETGEKSRVFEALVDYPCVFTMKIVGENEGSFVTDIVALVADACDTDITNVPHSTKAMGKWTSVTVNAPVENSQMLYSLYEKVDLDPRVKFKF